MSTRSRSICLAVAILASSAACERAREPVPAAPSTPAAPTAQTAAAPRGDAARSPDVAPDVALDVDAMRRAAADAGLTAPAEAAPDAAVAPVAPVAPAAALPTPRGFTVSALSPSRIALEWVAAEGAEVTKYQVLRDGAPAGVVAKASFADEGLRPSSRHCYAVIALDAKGNRSGPTRTACAETPDQSPPTVPPGLRAEARGERQVAVSWDPATDDVAVTAYRVLRGEAPVATVAGKAVTDSGLAPAQTYCYTVRAVDAAGNLSPPAGPACATTPDLTPPSRPDPVVAEARGERAIRVQWGPSADDVGVTEYELLRDGQVVATSGELAALESKLHPTHQYCYTVRARDAAGNRSAEGGPACATPPDLTAPTVPSGVVVTATSDTRVELRWTASEDEIGVQGYEVFRDRTSLAVVDATSSSEEGLRPAREYCYFIRARDAAGNVSAASKRACATTPDLKPPTAPTRLAAGPNSPTNVALAWGAAADDVAVTSYEIQRGGVAIARVDARFTHHLDVGLPPSSEACYAVVALDAAGNRSPPQGLACTKTADPGVPAGPTVLRAAPETTTSVALSWEPSPELGVVYAVYWDKDKGGRIGSTGNTAFSATVKNGERRCFRVAAVDGEGRESPRTFDACAAPRADTPRGTLSQADVRQLP